MNVRKPNEPNWIAALCRLYAVALWLYPRSHRERWGADMRLAFRDRCREAARDDRGPTQVLFSDLLPDVITSAGRERLDYFMEFHPMKRMLLVAMLFALLGLIFQARLSVAVEAVGDWWKQHEAALDAQAMKDHEAALASLVEQRVGLHADVMAARLYWEAGDGYRLNHPYPAATQLTASELAASDALLDRADVAFARAVRANDAWALWLATSDWNCPARKAVCNADEAAFRRLSNVDADNGVTWLVEMDRAKEAGDATRRRIALARLAHASRFDWHFGDSLHGMLTAFALRPLPHRLLQTYQNGEKATLEDSASLLAGPLGAENGTVAGPGYKALLDFCRTPDPSINTERAADCHAAGRLLAEHGTAFIDVMIGNRLWLRTATPDERAQIQQSIRNGLWLQHQLMNIGPETSADALRRWRAAWLESTSEMQVTTRLLHERGIPLQASPDFKVNPRDLDPAK